MLSDTDFAVLNAIYLKKMATSQTIAEVTALEPGVVSERLEAAADASQVMLMPTGAMLLEAGTAAVLETYREAYAAIRSEPALAHWYENFETINSRFIAQVSAWQHSDGDERIERRLLQTAERLTRDLAALVPKVPRYAQYIARFERSMERVDQGLRDYVCKPTIDSVHNIWFEFHEDILAVLGRPRDTT
ncbi:MAG: hypothetical protein JSR59_08765 [Proteobacteria bacterium]|nr:hypothetical protein [Pseudomonadota bacterium]